MTENEKKFEALKKEWIGQKVLITDKEHPWYNNTGEVKSFDETHAGIGIRIKLDNYQDDCYVFKGRDLKKV